MAGFRPNRFLGEVTSLLRKMVHDFSWIQTCSTKTNYWMFPSTFATNDYIQYIYTDIYVYIYIYTFHDYSRDEFLISHSKKTRFPHKFVAPIRSIAQMFFSPGEVAEGPRIAHDPWAIQQLRVGVKPLGSLGKHTKRYGKKYGKHLMYLNVS